MSRQFDVIIIGAGPAGLRAAHRAAALGLACQIVDEQMAPGGQIYRAIERVREQHPDDMRIFGDDYARGSGLVDDFRGSNIIYLPNTSVWRVGEDGSVCCTDGEKATIHKAKFVLIASGAMERPVAVPGWTLPGVMTAGAAQVLLKSAGIIPSGPTVIAGNSPLLMLVAEQLITAGTQVTAVLETARKTDYLAALPHLPRALLNPGMLRKGLAMRAAVRRSDAEVIGAVTGLSVIGESRAAGVRFMRGSVTRDIPAETVLLHDGIVPNTQITRQLGCRHEWMGEQRYWRPKLDQWGATSTPGFFVAGDGGGIVGAKAAEAAGELAILEIARQLTRIDEGERDRLARPIRKEIKRHLSIRPFLNRLFQPNPEAIVPPDDRTIVCRCEEVTAGDIRKAVAIGCPGPNQLKAFTRAGMGPCQGRMCALTVAEVMAAASGRPIEDVGYFRIRPPIKPLTLEELAAIDLEEA